MEILPATRHQQEERQQVPRFCVGIQVVGVFKNNSVKDNPMGRRSFRPNNFMQIKLFLDRLFKRSNMGGTPRISITNWAA